MVAEIVSPSTGVDRRWPERSSRALELLAEAAGRPLSPQAAWEAVSQVPPPALPEAGDMLRSLALAARRVGLRVGSCAPGWPCEAETLAALDGPAVTWLPGPAGGAWLLLLARRGRRWELVIVDQAGERRRRSTAARLTRWLDAHVPEGGASGPPWLRVEILLPLCSIESPDQSLPPLRRLLALARIERADLGVVLVYALTIGALSLAVPVAVQALVNTVAFGSLLQPLVVLSILLAAALSFVATLRVLEVVVVEAIQRRLFVRTAVDFARRLPRLSSTVRRDSYAPELANRFFDVVGLQKAGTKLLLDSLALLLQMAVGMLLLAFYHPILLAFDLALLGAVAVVIFVPGRGAVSTALAESSRKYAVAAWIEDVAASPLRFADPRSRAFADARAEVLGREWLQARGEHFRRVLRQLCGGLGLQVVATTALLGIGGALVIQRQLTLGQLVAAELVVASIGAGLGKLGRQLEAVYDAAASAAKLGKVVGLPLERGGGELLDGHGPLAFSGRMREGEPPIELTPGTKLGLRGLTREHSLLLDRLLGLAPAEQLDLRLDGRPIEAIELESLRSEVVLVREVELVAGTLLDNLAPTAAHELEAVRELLELVGLRERSSALPDGLQTRLLPSGAPLIACEARRLSLARALLRRPRLLLIDGGLDSLGLDPQARDRLLAHVLADDAPWTAIVVSDDPEVLARCRALP